MLLACCRHATGKVEIQPLVLNQTSAKEFSKHRLWRTWLQSAPRAVSTQVRLSPISSRRRLAALDSIDLKMPSLFPGALPLLHKDLIYIVELLRKKHYDDDSTVRVSYHFHSLTPLPLSPGQQITLCCAEHRTVKVYSGQSPILSPHLQCRTM